ncbi:hypothetical protein ACIQBJ_25130 [Kitasatospora sp. NPDC088391]|uniref:hypothetical protein n=1 Tax=Kitasatospora sp. NPDC088391 TaxID=3364074 RepID=UPI003808CC01
MSWDLLLLPVPADITSLDELPDDFTAQPLGSREQVTTALAARIPGIDLTDPTWGHLSGPTWSVELNIGSDDPIESLMLHIRGGGDVLQLVFRITDAVSCRALDVSEGVFLSTDAAAGWHSFQRFRERVTGEH